MAKASIPSAQVCDVNTSRQNPLCMSDSRFTNFVSEAYFLDANNPAANSVITK